MNKKAKLTTANTMTNAELAAELIDARKKDDELKEQMNTLAEKIGVEAHRAVLAELTAETISRTDMDEEVLRGNQAYAVVVTEVEKVALKDKKLTSTIVERAAKDFSTKGAWLFTTALNQKSAVDLYGARLPAFLKKAKVNKLSIQEVQ